jgi:hypothetical protein
MLFMLATQHRRASSNVANARPMSTVDAGIFLGIEIRQRVRRMIAE